MSWYSAYASSSAGTVQPTPNGEMPTGVGSQKTGLAGSGEMVSSELIGFDDAVKVGSEPVGADDGTKFGAALANVEANAFVVAEMLGVVVVVAVGCADIGIIDGRAVGLDLVGTPEVGCGNDDEGTPVGVSIDWVGGNDVFIDGTAVGTTAAGIIDGSAVGAGLVGTEVDAAVGVAVGVKLVGTGDGIAVGSELVGKLVGVLV